MSILPSSLRLGLIGYPLGHSLSPRIHTAALRALGLEGEYRLYPVPPRAERTPGDSEAEFETLADLLQQMRAGELHGLNVTISYKQTVIPLLDDLTGAARAVGAVNTIFVQGGRLIGDNTDAPGFWADLTRFLEDAGRDPGGSALILGAGGSARAVAYALLTHGYEVFVAARRLEQAAALCASLSAVRGRSSPLKLTVSAIRNLQSAIKNQKYIIINATPLGMSPHIAASPWPAALPFQPGVAVYDLVYNPAETSLVRLARAAGLPATTGLGMLIEQAALAFERWTGLPAPRSAMSAAATNAPMNQ